MKKYLNKIFVSEGKNNFALKRDYGFNNPNELMNQVKKETKDHWWYKKVDNPQKGEVNSHQNSRHT